MKSTDDTIIMAEIERAARAGLRCPTRDDLLRKGLSNPVASVQRLALEGKIRVEVYGKNWRTVWITAGPFRGLHTQLPPFRNNGPYLTNGPDRPSLPEQLVARP